MTTKSVFGTSSRSSPNLLAAKEAVKKVTPVILPPGRLRLATKPAVRKGFEAAVKAAGLGGDVTPHILRHTCATWLMQNGVDLWDAAGFLGMTVQQLETTYGHHHPDFQREAAEALGGQNGERNTVNKKRRKATNVTNIAEFSRPK